MPGAVDTHCHLDVEEFSEDRDDVVARARAAGVTAIVVPAIRPAHFARLRTLAARHPEVRLAYGIHPQVVPDLTDEEERAELPDGGVAIGECGLDGATADPARQERILRRQVAIARERRLPLLVHVLRAHDVAPRILRESGAAGVGGIMHSYSGGADLVPVYRDLGFAFSFAGPVTYENARRVCAAVRAVPDELLLAETDAPDQAPVPFRGTRSEPAYVRLVIEGLARARGVPVEVMAELTTRNAHRILWR